MRTTGGLILFAVLLFAGLTACQPSRTLRKEQAPFTFDGRVVHVQIEGGFFGLVDRRGNRYLPDRLPVDLRRHNLPVRVKATFLPPAPGYRMWGRRIHVEEIRPQ